MVCSIFPGRASGAWPCELPKSDEISPLADRPPLNALVAAVPAEALVVFQEQAPSACIRCYQVRCRLPCIIHLYLPKDSFQRTRVSQPHQGRAPLGRVLISFDPEADAGEGDCGEEVSCKLVMAGRDASEVLELVEEAFDEIALAVEIMGCGALLPAIPSPAPRTGAPTPLA